MARDQGSVRVEGIKEVRAELRAIDENFDRKLKNAYQRIANEVTDASQYAATAQGSTAAFVAPSIKTGTSVHGAVIRLGAGTLIRKHGSHGAGRGAGSTVLAALVAPGAEFGSSRYRQFPAWNGNGDGAGYFIYPTIRAMKPQIADTAQYEVEAAIKQVLPN